MPPATAAAAVAVPPLQSMAVADAEELSKAGSIKEYVFIAEHPFVSVTVTE